MLVHRTTTIAGIIVSDALLEIEEPVSVAKLMENSGDRFKRLEELLNQLSNTEEEIATKLGATLAISNLLTSDFFFAFDVTGKIVFASEAGELGYTQQELEGKHITNILPESKREEAWGRFLERLSGPEPIKVNDFDVEFCGRNGICKFFRLNLMDVKIMGQRIFAGVARLPENGNAKQ